jgi:hypothetical protein
MTRRVAWSAAALAIAAAAALAVRSAGRREASARAGAAEAERGGAAAPVAHPGAAAVPAGWAGAAEPGPSAAAEPPVPKQTIRGPRSAAASVAWDEVPIASRTYELGEVAAPVRAALEAARDQLDTCFDEEARLLARRPPPPSDGSVTGPGVLVLRLESRAGGLDVVDARLESLGTSTPELAECARHVLKDWPITAPGTAPGRRYRLRFVLQ